MEDLLDTIWFKIIDFFYYTATLLDTLFAPLNYFGPAFAIFTIAFFTVVMTKRYEDLQKQFVNLYNLRKEALKCEDREKGKLLVRNIDQGKLNQVYYNYFFEGFLLGIATKYLPILLLLSYVNNAYKSNNLLILFGREYVFKINSSSGEPVIIGAAFWFVISILFSYLGWFIIKRILSRFIKGNNVDLLEKDHLSA